MKLYRIDKTNAALVAAVSFFRTDGKSLAAYAAQDRVPAQNGLRMVLDVGGAAGGKWGMKRLPPAG